MYRNTRFRELLKGLPRRSFERSVEHFQGDKHAKGFRCWHQLIAMIYAQISGSKSLRELETGFNSQSNSHYDIGCRAIKRSTLADANAKRDSDLFAHLCGELLHKAHRKLRSELGDLLYLIDSTPIPLKGLGYDDWSKENRNDRSQGLKVHVQMVPDEATPVDLMITAPNVNDVEVGREIAIEKGATYVFDKGYCDYNWWYKLGNAGAYFVTRLKRNAGVRVVERLPIPGVAKKTILSDEVIRFKNRRPGARRINQHYETPLRKVVVVRPDKDTPIVLVTNDFQRSAEDIAALYKKRWAIELFFKWLKQNLKIKQFLGRSENAVKIQIYTALITYLLAYRYRQRHGLTKTLKMSLVELRAGLFQRPETDRYVHRKKQKWLRDINQVQGALAFE